MSSPTDRPIVIAGLDTHTIGRRLTAMALARAGWRVIDLGGQRTVDEITSDEIARLHPAAILISSQGGLSSQTIRHLAAARQSWPDTSASWCVRAVTGPRSRRRLESCMDEVFIDTLSSDEVVGALMRHPEVAAARGSAPQPVISRARLMAAEDIHNRPLSRARRALLRARLAVAPHWHRASPLDIAIPSTSARPAPQLQAEGEPFHAHPSLRPRARRDDILLARAGASVVGSPTASGKAYVPGLARQLRYLGPHQARHTAGALRDGITSVEGGGLSHCLALHADQSPTESLREWQEVDTLVALQSQTPGGVVERELCPAPGGGLVPPSLSLTVAMVEMLLAARQGVRSFAIGYQEMGSEIQDAAAVAAARQMARQYLDEAGYLDADARIAWHQWMGAFPLSLDAGIDAICRSTQRAHRAGVEKIVVRSPVDGRVAPTVDQIAAGVACARDALTRPLPALPSAPVTREKERIMNEVSSFMDAILGLSDDLAVATIRALNSGILDLPFSPSRYVRGEVTAARDLDGAVRFLDPGALPLSLPARRFHSAAMAARRNASPANFRPEQMIEADLSTMKRGVAVGRATTPPQANGLSA